MPLQGNALTLLPVFVGTEKDCILKRNSEELITFSKGKEVSKDVILASLELGRRFLPNPTTTILYVVTTAGNEIRLIRGPDFLKVLHIFNISLSQSQSHSQSHSG